MNFAKTNPRSMNEAALADSGPVCPQDALPGPLVSVLTPFLNEEAHLRECIESVLKQTYPHFEYILVDNASSDGSPRIAEEYARQDTRIRVVGNETVVSQMVNLNIAAAQVHSDAKYVKYCFGDDWLYPDCLERMITVMEANPRVGSVCAYTLVESDVFLHGPHPRNPVLSGREAARYYLLTGKQMFGSPTASMFRADVIRERPQFFNPDRVADDIEPEMNSFWNWDFAFLHEILSFTRREGQGLSTKMIRLNLFAASRLISLHKHGHRFLNPAEYRSSRREVLREYGRAVAKSAMSKNFREVIRSHQAELAKAGLSLPKLAIALGALNILAEILFNPYRTVTILLHRYSTRNR